MFLRYCFHENGMDVKLKGPWPLTTKILIRSSRLSGLLQQIWRNPLQAFLRYRDRQPENTRKYHSPENRVALCSSTWSLTSELLESDPLTLWVHLLGDLQSVRVGEVSVGRCDGQDQTAVLADELHQHISDLVFYVDRLVSDGNLSHSRKVNQGQVQHWATSNTNEICK